MFLLAPPSHSSLELASFSEGRGEACDLGLRDTLPFLLHAQLLSLMCQRWAEREENKTRVSNSLDITTVLSGLAIATSLTSAGHQCPHCGKPSNSGKNTSRLKPNHFLPDALCPARLSSSQLPPGPISTLTERPIISYLSLNANRMQCQFENNSSA